MDGTGVPVRKKELVDRPGKQPDGSSKTREVKLVTIWSAEGRDKEGTPVRDAGFIGVGLFLESNLTCLISGAVARPLFDRFRLSREKLAYFSH